MQPLINPFDSLYVTETIDPESFVDVFSPLLVHDTAALYRPGNVVLVGTQGTGKSMLLTLLKPETRLAYATAGKAFPLAEGASPFIGAGVNLTRSGAIDFGQRPIGADGRDAPAELEAFFGDFLNYWIVRDLLDSIHLLLANQVPSASLGLNGSPASLDKFAATLAQDECWFGALAGVTDFAGLRRGLTGRIRVYRDFFNYNSDAIAADVATTKTSAGEPVSVAAEQLRRARVVSDAVEIFVRIDQYEELEKIADWQSKTTGHSANYASVVHKMLGLRDPRVSYRIGVRRHSWHAAPRMQGTTAVLEEDRNYKVVDLDDVLGSQEHRTAIFERFAEDVFRRRLTWAGYAAGARKGQQIKETFGASMLPREKARIYARDNFRPRPPAEWPPELRALIGDLAESDPLSARWAEAYALQKGAAAALQTDAEGRLPWDRREWWRKERVAQGLLQIAARQQQRMLWSGRDDVLALAGGNVLVFVSLCQSIWDAWLRRPEAGPESFGPPRIHHPYTQDEGIRNASQYWYRKIRADPDGDKRQRFVNVIGELFRDWLRSDQKMSYPGHNGFSVDVDDLAADAEVNEFLRQAAAYGILVDRLHTTRNKGGGRRHKWYLASIYAPYFQLPTTHVKEPRYVSVAEVRGWLVQARVLQDHRLSPAKAERQPSLQASLFDA